MNGNSVKYPFKPCRILMLVSLNFLSIPFYIIDSIIIILGSGTIIVIHFYLSLFKQFLEKYTSFSFALCIYFTVKHEEDISLEHRPKTIKKKLTNSKTNRNYIKKKVKIISKEKKELPEHYIIEIKWRRMLDSSS